MHRDVGTWTRARKRVFAWLHAFASMCVHAKACIRARAIGRDHTHDATGAEERAALPQPRCLKERPLLVRCGRAQLCEVLDARGSLPSPSCSSESSDLPVGGLLNGRPHSRAGGSSPSIPSDAGAMPPEDQGAAAHASTNWSRAKHVRSGKMQACAEDVILKAVHRFELAVEPCF
eukprot:1573496-Pleurochrysis_carterae.AAC.3